MFQNGTQSPNHPKPGEPYYAIGFPKTAFLPDNEQVSLLNQASGHLFFFRQGRSILDLLEKAFNLGHTFAVNTAGKLKDRKTCGTGTFYMRILLRRHRLGFNSS